MTPCSSPPNRERRRLPILDGLTRTKPRWQVNRLSFLSGTRKVFFDEQLVVLTNAFVVVGSDVDHAQHVPSFPWLAPPRFCYGEIR